MKTRSKALLLSLCAILLVASTVFGTLAYLTDTDNARNTFTVGKVDIKLDEAKVTPDGAKVEPEERVQSNDYHLLPGHTYVKDPTVTVIGGSDASYVRMLVTVNDISKLTSAITAEAHSDFYGTYGENGGSIFLLEKLVNGWDSTKWLFEGYATKTDAETKVTSATYEFRYFESVSALTDSDDEGTEPDAVVLDALFDSITMPTFLDNAEIALMNEVVISIEANAIQSSLTNEASTADAAWQAFDAQQAAK